MRAWQVVLAVLAVAGVLAWEAWHNRPPPPYIGPTVRIAAWNLRHFSDREALDFALIADIIHDADFHVLALQEVQGDGKGVDRLLQYLGSDWRAELGPDTEGGHRLAFLWNRTVARPTGGFTVLPGSAHLERRPFVGRFTAGGFDVTLVNVHLYRSDLARRRNEARTVAGVLYDADVPAGSGERDVVVLGDFNTTSRRAGSLAPFEQRGWTAAIDEPTNLNGDDVLDNLVFDADELSEWTGHAGVVKFDETRFANEDAKARSAVSDHRPVWADFATRPVTP